MYDISLTRNVWAEINLDNLIHNISEVKRLSQGTAKILAIVKGDAYGHGARQMAKTMIENGVDRFAVAILDEALELRSDGIAAPILVLGYTQKERFKFVVANDIEQTIYSLEAAKELSLEAGRQGKEVRIHVKIDTGLGRIGFKADESSITTIKEISMLPNIIIEGIFTHFATAHNKNKDFTIQQFERFYNICSKLEDEGMEFKFKHCANSATIIDHPNMYMDMIRSGSILYGLAPSQEVKLERINLQQVISLKALITHVKEIDVGESVSYNREFIALRKTKVASLPLGYADGYSKKLSGKAEVLVHGKRVPVIGAICMDQCMIDVTNIPDIKVGDEVVLLGKQKCEFISADEIAEKLEIPYTEVVSRIGRRVPRVYIKGGKVTNIVNHLFPYE